MTCPNCGGKLVGKLTYPFKNAVHFSRYCLAEDKWVPKPLGHWEVMWPRKGEAYTESDPDADGRKLRRR